eukprot:3325877-Pleurochrysis_carterae.AAC.1
MSCVAFGVFRERRECLGQTNGLQRCAFPGVGGMPSSSNRLMTSQREKSGQERGSRQAGTEEESSFLATARARVMDGSPHWGRESALDVEGQGRQEG